MAVNKEVIHYSLANLQNEADWKIRQALIADKLAENNWCAQASKLVMTTLIGHSTLELIKKINDGQVDTITASDIVKTIVEVGMRVIAIAALITANPIGLGIIHFGVEDAAIAFLSSFAEAIWSGVKSALQESFPTLVAPITALKFDKTKLTPELVKNPISVVEIDSTQLSSLKQELNTPSLPSTAKPPVVFTTRWCNSATSTEHHTPTSPPAPSPK